MKKWFFVLVITLQANVWAGSDTQKISQITNYLLTGSGSTSGLDVNGDSKVDIADLIFTQLHPAPAIIKLAIAGGASTATNRTVTLNNTCSTTPTQYMASESANFSGASWSAYASAPKFTLSEGNLTKTVYFKVRNGYAMESDVVSDTIGLLETTTLSVGASAITGKISPAGDCDWFKFVVSSTSTYVIESWAGTLTDNKMTLYGPNSNTTQITSNDNAGTGNMAKIALTLEAGTYYVKVIAASGTGDYTIRVTNIGALKVSSFKLDGGDDNTTTRGVTLNNTCGGAPTSYMASESSSFSGASWQAYSTAPKFTVSSGSGTKKVYFKVKDAGGTESDTVSDSIAYIEVVGLPSDGTIVSGTIKKSSEEDWYVLKIDSAAIYSIATYEGSLVDTSLGIAGSVNPDDDEWKAENSDTSTDNLMSNVTLWLEPGTYYVRVKSGDGSTGTYTIRAWPTENTKLTVNGSTVAEYIQDSDEVDWYRFTVSSSGVYTVQTAEYDFEYGKMELYSSAFEKIAVDGDGIGPNANDMPCITAYLSAGTYIVRFSGASSDDLGYYYIKAFSGSVTGATVALMIDGPTAGGVISSSSETDWYQFVVTDEDSYTIETTAGTMSTGYLTLRDEDLALIDSSSSATTGEMPELSTTLEPGVYYIGMSAYSSTGSYKIKLKD